jgi:hypothetical protein
MTSPWAFTTILLGGIATLAIYSFLYRENPFYRAFEHVYIGLATGLGVVITLERWLWPKLLKPILDVGPATFATPPQWIASRGADLATPVPYNPLYLLYLIPMVFGLGYYAIFSRKYQWVARIVISFSLGYGAGLSFKGFFAEFVPQVVSSFKPLWVPGDWQAGVNNIIFVGTLVCVMTYFFFSFEHDKPVIKQASAAGRWLMMISFGAFFGATIMARMSLLIERLQFFIEQWIPNFKHLWGG